MMSSMEVNEQNTSGEECDIYPLEDVCSKANLKRLRYFSIPNRITRPHVNLPTTLVGWLS